MMPIHESTGSPFMQMKAPADNSLAGAGECPGHFQGGQCLPHSEGAQQFLRVFKILLKMSARMTISRRFPQTLRD